MSKIKFFLSLLIASVLTNSSILAQSAQATRTIQADYKKEKGPLGKIYQECVGAGRASEGLRADWQEQLTLVQKSIGFKYIRFHGLLCDEMHVYTEDDNGNAIYN